MKCLVSSGATEKTFAKLSSCYLLNITTELAATRTQAPGDDHSRRCGTHVPGRSCFGNRGCFFQILRLFRHLHRQWSKRNGIQYKKGSEGFYGLAMEPQRNLHPHEIQSPSDGKMERSYSKRATDDLFGASSVIIVIRSIE